MAEQNSTDNRTHRKPRTPIFPAFPKVADDATFIQRMQAFAGWLQASRPLRALKHWTDSQGALLAGGMAYAALFSFFAGILVFFSVAGIVLANRPDLTEAIIESLADSIPGLIGEDGVVSADALTGLSASFTVAGVIALLSGLWTAMNFLNGARMSIRAVFELPPQPKTNFVVTKLLDLLLMLGFGLMIAVSAVLTAASSDLTTWLFREVLHLDVGAAIGVIVRVLSLLIGIAFDAVIVALVLQVMCRLRVPAPILWQGAFVGAVLLQLLKQAGSMLIGGASSNPLLATFAALLGVLIFFNFACMVLLITASWVKVTMDDNAVSPRLVTVEEAEKITRATERQALRERLATESIQVKHELSTTPRWRRRKLRRQYEQIVARQHALDREEREIELETLGYRAAETNNTEANSDEANNAETKAERR